MGAQDSEKIASTSTAGRAAAPSGAVRAIGTLESHPPTGKIGESIRQGKQEIPCQPVGSAIDDHVFGYTPRHVCLFVEQVISLETNSSVTAFQKLLFDISIDDHWISIH